MVQYEIKVSGRVQGVGYRFYTEKIAARLGLKGWVKNNYDRTVTVIVQGEKDELETFIDYLKVGPALSRVDNISKYKMPVVTVLTNFTVKY